jgi:hypothetical protein
MPEPAIILWTLLFASIGIGYFIYGKRQDQQVVRYRECPANCVNPVIHITLEELMNHGINNERRRPAGHGRQGGW